jgi:hypothetical protein
VITRHVPIALISLVSVFCLISIAHAAPRNAERACAWDYRNFCSEWGIGTAGLNNCMRRNGRHLSEGCVRALVQAGKVSRSEVQKRRVKYGR